MISVTNRYTIIICPFTKKVNHFLLKAVGIDGKCQSMSIIKMSILRFYRKYSKYTKCRKIIVDKFQLTRYNRSKARGTNVLFLWIPLETKFPIFTPEIMGKIFGLYSVEGKIISKIRQKGCYIMGRQINHEGINNSMMGTETVEPVTQYDILEGQCGAAIDGRPLPEEGEHLTNEELQFIAITKDNTIRLNLLERLQELGELAAFLEAENETI